ncbi:MAG: Re/Si-specific NAD(P)(+) transhydrogenase subunit alpha [Rhodospirillaceae bacterium]|nr:Re/Si-specific NAD(P)(+) transhydrogenase subunit alpha [Rhodospirillaceae bacterium]
MKIAIPKESHPGELRVATTPDIVKKLKGFGFDVIVETGAGNGASITDDDFKSAGATIAKDADATFKSANVVLKVGAPSEDELKKIKKGAVVVAHLGILGNKKDANKYAKAGITTFAMELMPRISRAQSMDILSSQSNLAGYKAVLDAASEYGSAMPMMMTAAGTIAPAKVFIMGVGVAGLQAIATAKRLGAVVTATDVRPATREQVESLGGKFLTVDEEMEREAETEGGYAKQMPPEYFEKQKQVVAEHIKKQDIVITTALIPGRAAPVLVTSEMVASMHTGAVIIDLAVEAGGNVEGAKLGKVVETKNGVKIVGHENVPSRLASDASKLFAKNLLNFLSPHVNEEKKTIEFDWEDETVSGTCITRDGKIVHSMFAGPTGQKKPEKNKEKDA